MSTPTLRERIAAALAAWGGHDPACSMAHFLAADNGLTNAVEAGAALAIEDATAALRAERVTLLAIAEQMRIERQYIQAERDAALASNRGDELTDIPARMPNGSLGQIYMARGYWYVTADDESFDSGPHADKAAAQAALAAAKRGD